MAQLTQFKVFDRKPAKLNALLLTEADISDNIDGTTYSFNGVDLAVPNLAGAEAGDYLAETAPGVYALVKQHVFVRQYFA